METKVKAKFTAIVTNWLRFYFSNNDNTSNEFPLDVIQLIVNIFLYQKVKFLAFSSTHKCPGITLSDDNKCAYKPTEHDCDQNVLMDCNPAKTITLWRIKVW